MALIELDLTARPAPPPTSIPPAHRYRFAGLIVAAVLAAALGGAAPAAPMLWRLLGSVPAVGAEVPFELTAGRLYTMASDGTERTVTAWSLDDRPRRLWTSRFPAWVIDKDKIGFSGADAAYEAGDVVLLADGPRTTVVDARTGALGWTSEVAVTPLAGGRVGVVQEQRFRPGTLYDQASGDPGLLYFSSTGEPHTEPPIRTEVHGVELATGRRLWTAAAGGSVNVAAAPGDAAAVLILSSERLERRDGGTGRVQRQVAMPRLGGSGPTGSELIADRLMVRYGAYGAAGHEIAYAPDSLARSWERDVPEVLVDPPTCVDVLCAGNRRRLDVLDPATGRPRWRVAPDVDLRRRAGLVLEAHAISGRPVRLADPVTGRTRVDLRGWQADVSGPPELAPVLRRPDGPRGSLFALADVPRRRVQPLGRVSGPVSECANDGRHVVCRGLDDLRIWAYRA